MTLTIQDLGALGELLGSVAVLATLVYLALQTRQNTMAISAQLDSAHFAARQNSALSVATSNEILEALREDSTASRTINQMRLDAFWRSVLLDLQWALHHARRGLLPSFNEGGTAEIVRIFFSGYRSFEGWWERTTASYVPEFVEWVEEQRSKAA